MMRRMKVLTVQGWPGFVLAACVLLAGCTTTCHTVRAWLDPRSDKTETVPLLRYRVEALDLGTLPDDPYARAKYEQERRECLESLASDFGWAEGRISVAELIYAASVADKPLVPWKVDHARGAMKEGDWAIARAKYRQIQLDCLAGREDGTLLRECRAAIELSSLKERPPRVPLRISVRRKESCETTVFGGLVHGLSLGLLPLLDGKWSTTHEIAVSVGGESPVLVTRTGGADIADWILPFLTPYEPLAEDGRPWSISSGVFFHERTGTNLLACAVADAVQDAVAGYEKYHDVARALETRRTPPEIKRPKRQEQTPKREAPPPSSPQPGPKSKEDVF